MLFCGSVGGSGLYQVTPTFWDGVKSFLGGEQATIPHFKDDIQGFHMHPKPAIVISDFLEVKAESHLCHFPPRMYSPILIFILPPFVMNNQLS